MWGKMSITWWVNLARKAVKTGCGSELRIQNLNSLIAINFIFLPQNSHLSRSQPEIIFADNSRIPILKFYLQSEHDIL